MGRVLGPRRSPRYYDHPSTTSSSSTLRQHDLNDEPLGGFLLLDKVFFDQVALSSFKPKKNPPI